MMEIKINGAKPTCVIKERSFKGTTRGFQNSAQREVAGPGQGPHGSSPPGWQVPWSPVSPAYLFKLES